MESYNMFLSLALKHKSNLHNELDLQFSTKATEIGHYKIAQQALKNKEFFAEAFELKCNRFVTCESPLFAIVSARKAFTPGRSAVHLHLVY